MNRDQYSDEDILIIAFECKKVMSRLELTRYWDPEAFNKIEEFKSYCKGIMPEYVYNSLGFK